jgi:hypothetical protein
VVINRVDELPPAEIAELQTLIEKEYPGRPVLRCSAKTGEGFAALTETLELRGQFGQRVMEVDYDIYAEGEAELGWLNSQVEIAADNEFELDALLMDLIHRLHARLLASSAEAAHLKVIGLCDASYAVANVVSNATGPELSLPSGTKTPSANVVVNARVAIDPAELEVMVREALSAATVAINATHKIVSLQSFRPGRPVPTHRIQ